MNHKLSIVIIGRNEEKSIGKCLEAALSAAQEISNTEIIFVDSASTDKTVSVVQSFGVRVISLLPTMKLSPSAGRYVGSQYAQGEYILFVDADTLVYKNFLSAAIKHFENNPKIAGINGWIDDLNEKGEMLKDVEPRFDKITDVKWLRGPCCLYRKAALQINGSFNPYLMVEEEAELGLRLIKNHWKLCVLPVPMACHTRCYHLQTLSSLIAAFKRDIDVKRAGELTKTAAYAFKEGFGLAFCWLRLKTTIIFSAWLVLLVLCFFLPNFLYPKVDFFLIVLLVGVVVLLKKRSITQTLVFFATKFLTVVDLFMGLPKLNFKHPLSFSMDIIEHKVPLQTENA